MTTTQETPYLCIRGGRVIDPTNNRDETADLLVHNDRIIAIGRPEIPSRCHMIEADGLIVAPGLVDMHAHLREPGFEYKETIASGTAAAVAGGITSVAAMPNTHPVNDDPSVTSYILGKAREAGLARVWPIGAITRHLKGQELAEIGLLKKAGCVAFSDDGKPVVNSGIMRRAMEYSRAFDALLIQHAEDPALVGEGCVHEGAVASRLGLPGYPAVAEEIIVERDIRLAALTQARYHVAHISTAGAVHAVERARQQGLAVSCEVTPHHFSLTDDELITYDTNFKMSPPLRSDHHRQALLEGLARGVITVIATDHAPHDVDSKQVEFGCAANGVVGFETLLAVSLELVAKGVLTLMQCLAALTCNPARLLGLDVGTLTLNRLADIVLFDPKAEWVVDAHALHGLGRNTCFHGRRVTGRVKMTLVGGRVVYVDGAKGV
ncbi:MAG: dihydroorotase [Magnetococcus sp. DMHC-6]